MKEIVLVCSGTTEESSDKKLVGWQDVRLSKTGLEEEYRAGRILRNNGYTFDLAFTSVLTRGIQSLWQILDAMDLHWLKVNKNWRLNGRYYGQLEGMSYQQIAEVYGAEKLELWMNDYKAFVPTVEIDDPRHPSHDPRYGDLIPEEIPQGENLVETFSRVFPHWDNKIKPMIAIDRKVLVVGHHNSIRALMSMMEDTNIEEIISRPIIRGIPMVYRLDDELNFLSRAELFDD